MSTFEKGDIVWFIDKYGVAQKGTFDGQCSDAEWQGWAIVNAKAFADLGSSTDVRCLVPLNRLQHHRKKIR